MQEVEMISQYFAPTKVIFGQGAENEVGTQLEALVPKGFFSSMEDTLLRNPDFLER